MLSTSPQQRVSNYYIDQDRPCYRIDEEKGFYGPDDRLHKKGEIIYFDDEPSFNMHPMNDLAKKAKLELLEKLDTHGRAVAAATGKAYTSLADALKNAREFAQQSSSILRLGEQEDAPLLGKRKPGRPRVEQVVPMDGPAEITDVKKKKLSATDETI